MFCITNNVKIRRKPCFQSKKSDYWHDECGHRYSNLVTIVHVNMFSDFQHNQVSLSSPLSCVHVNVLMVHTAEATRLNGRWWIVCRLSSLHFPSQVYDRVAEEEVLPLDRRLRRLRAHCGPIAGSIFAFVAVLDFLFLLLLQWLVPDRVMDVAVDTTGPHGLWLQETSSKNEAHSKSATKRAAERHHSDRSIPPPHF